MEWLKRLFGWKSRDSARPALDESADQGARAAAVALEPAVVIDEPSAAPAAKVVEPAPLSDEVPAAVVDDASTTTPLAATPEPDAAEPGPAEPDPIPPDPPLDPAPDVAPALRPALAAFRRGEFKSALAVASTHASDRDAVVRLDAHRLCARSLAGLERWDEAFDHWLALFDDEPTADCALQLATTSVMCDEAERGEAWLERFDQLNARDLSPALARSRFVAALARRGEMSLALPHLQWLRDVYLQLHVTDPVRLQQRGVPPFDDFLASSLPILRGALSPLDVRSWYAALDGQLDEPGQQRLQQWVTALAKAA